MVDDLRLLLEAREAAQTGRGALLRKASGLTQGEVARAIGVEQSTLSRWESGVRRRPAGPEAMAWSRLLRDLAAYLGASSRLPEDVEGANHERDPAGKTGPLATTSAGQGPTRGS